MITAPGPTAQETSAQQGRNPSSIFIGLLIGAPARWVRRGISPAPRPSRSHRAGPATGPAKLPEAVEASPITPAGQAGGPVEKPQFDFYKILPQGESGAAPVPSKPQADAARRRLPTGCIFRRALSRIRPKRTTSRPSWLWMGIEASVARATERPRNRSWGSCRTLFLRRSPHSSACVAKWPPQESKRASFSSRPNPEPGPTRKRVKKAWHLNVLTESMTGFRSPGELGAQGPIPCHRGNRSVFRKTGVSNGSSPSMLKQMAAVVGVAAMAARSAPNSHLRVEPAAADGRRRQDRSARVLPLCAHTVVTSDPAVREMGRGPAEGRRVKRVPAIWGNAQLKSWRFLAYTLEVTGGAACAAHSKVFTALQSDGAAQYRGMVYRAWIANGGDEKRLHETHKSFASSRWSSAPTRSPVPTRYRGVPTLASMAIVPDRGIDGRHPRGMRSRVADQLIQRVQYPRSPSPEFGADLWAGLGRP